jgi:stage V sporulation protein G
MEITEVRIVPSDDERIVAYASITIDDSFVIHGLRLKISKKGDYFLFMPRRRQADGNYTYIAFPLNNETRQMIVEKVFAAYKVFINEPVNRSARE